MSEVETLDPTRLLAGVRVVELCDGLGEYGGRLLAGLGADVTHVFDSARAKERFSGRETYHNYRKRLVEYELGTEDGRRQVGELLYDADILLQNQPLFNEVELADINPRLVAVSITPFGLSGPYRDYEGSDLVATATGGLLSMLGSSTRPPTRLGGMQAWDTAACAGAIGGLLGLRQLELSGRAPAVEVSAQDAVLMSTENAIGFITLMNQVRKRVGGTGFSGQSMTHKSKDGIIVGHLGRRFDAFLDWRESHGLPSAAYRDAPWDDLEYRLAHAGEVEELILELFGKLTNEEVFDQGQPHRLIMLPVRKLSEVLKDVQLAFRKYFVPVPGEDGVVQPGLPYSFRTAVGPAKPVPNPAPEPGKPLRGVRILDLGTNIAIPLIGKLASVWGADVIKVESSRHVDSLRNTPFPRPPGTDNDGNHNWLSANSNTGKRSVVVNLGTDRGREIFLDLVKTADVVMDNYGVDPTPKWRLTFHDMLEVKPDSVYLRSSVMGRQGPRKSSIGTGNAIAAMGGLGGLTGFAADEPWGTGTAHPDYTSSCHHGLFAMLAALRYRDRTGNAVEVDFSQVEGVASFLGGEFIEMQRLGEDLPRLGNQFPGYFLHGVYPCAGDDRWIAVSVQETQAWLRLLNEIAIDGVEILGPFIEANDSPDTRDALFVEWTKNLDERELTRRLQRIGVAAGPVLYSTDVLADPHFAARKILQKSQHGALGETIMIGSHILLDGRTGDFPRPSPLLGEHTDEILQELGLAEDEIGMLYVEEVLA